MLRILKKLRTSLLFIKVEINMCQRLMRHGSYNKNVFESIYERCFTCTSLSKDANMSFRKYDMTYCNIWNNPKWNVKPTKTKCYCFICSLCGLITFMKCHWPRALLFLIVESVRLYTEPQLSRIKLHTAILSPNY